MSDKWYISRDGRQYGPYTWEALISYARSGNVLGQDLLWSDATSKWIRADDVPGLLTPVPDGGRAAPPLEGTDRKPGRTSDSKPTWWTRKETLLVIGGGALVLLLACGGAFVFLGQDLRGLLGGDSPITVAEDEVVPFWEEDAESVLGTLDDPDWRGYPDREAEEEAIARTINGFSDAMKQGDLDASVAYILDERQQTYRELFSANPEAMAPFADVISSGEMSFLSEHAGPTPYHRIAEYAVKLDGFTFYVVLMKVGDSWMVYDF